MSEIDQTKKEGKQTGFGRSWEAELLISGGALLTLIQITISLGEFMMKLMDVGGVIAVSIIMIPFATAGLVGGFSIHLILRGFWVSLVMLKKIYPNEINFEKLKLAEPYLTKTKNFSLQKRIEFLDITCSKVFVFSFAFTFLIIGFFIVYFVIMIPMILGNIWPSLYQNLFFSIFSFILAACWILFFYLDLLTVGFLRRGKIAPKLYYPIYIVFNTLSLGFLWRPIINILFTNATRKSFLIFLIIIFYAFGFLLVAGFADSNADILTMVDDRKYKIATTQTNSTKYRDQSEGNSWIKNPTIQSQIIAEGYLDVFVPYSSFDDSVIDSLTRETKFFTSIVGLKMDGINLNNLQWIGLKKSNGQSGATTVINIRDLETKLHTLTIEVKGKEPVEIPFWKQ